MKKIFFALTLCCALSFAKAQSVFTSKNGTIDFFSKTPMADIDATNKSVRSVLNTATREVLFIAPIRQFKFKKALMEEHFNENYLESDKFPDATFKGSINEAVDFLKDGTYPVTATGTLKIHGVEKPRTESGTVIVNGKNIELKCTFKVQLVDFNIEIPKLVTDEIAKIIDVSVDIPYVPYVKEEKK